MMNCEGRDEKLRNKHWRNGPAELVGNMFCTGSGFHIVEHLLNSQSRFTWKKYRQRLCDE
jgi:hypothetical protein